jgi:hypothetical protein
MFPEPGGGDAMFRFSQSIARVAASSVFLFAFNLNVAMAGDQFRREPTMSHLSCKSCRYTRETNHGLIHYPCATYWTSGDAIDHWGNIDSPASGYSSHDITPSPWAYRTIAPYAHQYRSFNGTGFGASGCYDCRN